MENIIILGTGGNCLDILDSINDINNITPTYEVLGFLDDHPDAQGTVVMGKPVLGKLCDAPTFNNSNFVNGIGSEYNFWKKEEIINSTAIDDSRFKSIIHPSASVSSSSYVGKGTVIFQNVTITSNVKIGNHVIILPNSVISHDSIIEDYCCIAGCACINGQCHIGKSSYLGSNSSLKGHIRIGDESLIGMGSVVVKDVPPRTVVMGSPASFSRYTY